MTVDAELFADVLPTYLARFVGRESECADVTAQLTDPGLVTVCGIGGSGKTRLAVEVAKRARADEAYQVCWVSLATTTSAAEVGPAIARALGSGVEHAAQLETVLSQGRRLLVLDNCEQVAASCRELLTRVLSSCGSLRVLATSRIPLGAEGERVYVVPPLSGGDPADARVTNDATALFVDRAASVASSYALTELNGPILAEICRTLHGLPLAIELAASWIRVLSPRDLLTALTEAHATLGSDATGAVEPRHRSIDAVLDSSWSWLSAAERSAIEALGVFVGGFTPEAAGAVAGADLGTLLRLSQLALIQRLPDPYGGSRYQVHELVRQYALSRLESTVEVRERHLGFFLDLVEGFGASVNTAIEARSFEPAAADTANIDAAVVFALGRQEAELAQRLAVGLDYFWPLCLPSYEHRVARLAAALALPGPTATPGAVRARAQALLILGRREVGNDPARSRTCYSEARLLFRQIDDAAGVAACIRDRGNARLAEGDHRRCRQDCVDSLARCRACGDHQGAAWCLESIGAAALLAGDLEVAIARLNEASADFAARHAPFGVCTCELEAALAYQLRGDWVESIDACLRALDQQSRHRLAATAGDLLEVVARLCVGQRRWAAAARLYGAAASWHADHDQQSWYPFVARFSLADRARENLGHLEWIEEFEAGLRLGPEQANRVATGHLAELRRRLQADSSGLSPREIEVLRLVGAGLTDSEIANRLVLSLRTVHAHLRSIYRKLGVGSRTAAVRAAAAVAIPGLD